MGTNDAGDGACVTQNQFFTPLFMFLPRKLTARLARERRATCSDYKYFQIKYGHCVRASAQVCIAMMVCNLGISHENIDAFF